MSTYTIADAMGREVDHIVAFDPEDAVERFCAEHEIEEEDQEFSAHRARGGRDE